MIRPFIKKKKNRKEDISVMRNEDFNIWWLYHWTAASAAEFVSLGLSRLIVFMLSDIALYIPACYPLTCAEYAYAREPAAK
jgi:hypothetical protein